MLNLTEAVRYQQWQEARHAKAFSGRSPTRVHRYTYYELLLGNTAEVIVIPELDALDLGGLAARRFRQQEPDLTQRPFGTSVVADVQSSGGGRKLSAQEVEELSLLLQLLTSQHRTGLPFSSACSFDRRSSSPDMIEQATSICTKARTRPETQTRLNEGECDCSDAV